MSDKPFIINKLDRCHNFVFTVKLSNVFFMRYFIFKNLVKLGGLIMGCKIEINTEELKND